MRNKCLSGAAGLPCAGRFGGFGLAPKPPAALAFFLAAAATPRRGGAVCGASAAAEQPSRRTALIVSALHGEEPPNHPRFALCSGLLRMRISDALAARSKYVHAANI